MKLRLYLFFWFLIIQATPNFPMDFIRPIHALAVSWNQKRKTWIYKLFNPYTQRYEPLRTKQAAHQNHPAVINPINTIEYAFFSTILSTGDAVFSSQSELLQNDLAQQCTVAVQSKTLAHCLKDTALGHLHRLALQYHNFYALTFLIQTYHTILITNPPESISSRVCADAIRLGQQVMKLLPFLSYCEESNGLLLDYSTHIFEKFTQCPHAKANSAYIQLCEAITAYHASKYSKKESLAFKSWNTCNTLFDQDVENCLAGVYASAIPLVLKELPGTVPEIKDIYQYLDRALDILACKLTPEAAHYAFSTLQDDLELVAYHSNNIMKMYALRLLAILAHSSNQEEFSTRYDAQLETIKKQCGPQFNPELIIPTKLHQDLPAEPSQNQIVEMLELIDGICSRFKKFDIQERIIISEKLGNYVEKNIVPHLKNILTHEKSLTLMLRYIRKNIELHPDKVTLTLTSMLRTVYLLRPTDNSIKRLVEITPSNIIENLITEAKESIAKKCSKPQTLNLCYVLTCLATHTNIITDTDKNTFLTYAVAYQHAQSTTCHINHIVTQNQRADDSFKALALYQFHLNMDPNTAQTEIDPISALKKLADIGKGNLEAQLYTAAIQVKTVDDQLKAQRLGNLLKNYLQGQITLTIPSTKLGNCLFQHLQTSGILELMEQIINPHDVSETSSLMAQHAFTILRYIPFKSELIPILPDLIPIVTLYYTFVYANLLACDQCDSETFSKHFQTTAQYLANIDMSLLQEDYPKASGFHAYISNCLAIGIARQYETSAKTKFLLSDAMKNQNQLAYLILSTVYLHGVGEVAQNRELAELFFKKALESHMNVKEHSYEYYATKTLTNYLQSFFKIPQDLLLNTTTAPIAAQNATDT